MQILGDGFVLKFTPRARGLTRQYDQLKFHYAIYPACAGINPHLGQIVLICLHLPRVCGDQPGYTFVLDYWCEFTPRARGSTPKEQKRMRWPIIYPACAGINLSDCPICEDRIHLPRMRGDQPNGYATCNVEKEFTPQARGSTQFDMPPARRASIYPACAGITLRYSAPVTAQKDLPRTCGDQPAIENCCAFQRKFTPHTRGST